MLFFISSCNCVNRSAIADCNETCNDGPFLTEIKLEKRVNRNNREINIELAPVKIDSIFASSKIFFISKSRILKISTVGFEYELSFPLICIIKDDTCYVYFSELLDKFEINHYRNFLPIKFRNYVLLYSDENHKYLLDGKTKEAMILIMSNMTENRILYAIKQGNFNKPNSKYYDGCIISFYFPLSSLPFEIDSINVSNAAYPLDIMTSL